MAKRNERIERKVTDSEIALLSDLDTAYMQLALKCGWRRAIVAVLYVLQRHAPSRGSKWLIEYMTAEGAQG